MTESVFRRVIDQLDQMGVKKVFLHQFGESLLHPQIYEFIDYAAQKPNIELLSLSTNATALNERISRRILDTGLRHLVISVDADTEATYNEVRGPDFARTLRNTRQFLALHRERESRMAVNLTIIRMGIKADQVDDFKRTWAPYATHPVKINVKTLVNFGGLVDTNQFGGDGSGQTAPDWDGP
jgi:MoaA/NifB/PqqE/SkfB family radical SAM enzyme